MPFIKTVLFTVIFPGTATVLFPHLLISLEPWPFAVDLGRVPIFGISLLCEAL